MRLFQAALDTPLDSPFSATLWAVTWGGAKRMGGGGKRTRERTLPKIFGPLQKELLVCSVVAFRTGKTEH